MVQAEDPNGGGKALLSTTRGVDFGGQGVKGGVFLGGDGAEGVPELGFEGDAGAVAVEGDRVFGGAGGHAATVAQRLALSPEFSKGDIILDVPIAESGSV